MLWGGESGRAIVKCGVSLRLNKDVQIKNNTNRNITDIQGFHVEGGDSPRDVPNAPYISAINSSKEKITYLIDNYPTHGGRGGLKFNFNNNNYIIQFHRDGITGRYLLSIVPDDLSVRVKDIYISGTDVSNRIEIYRNIKQTGIKSTISNLNSIRLLYNNVNAGVGRTHIPPEYTQPTNFSLKLHKFILYSGRYKEKEGESRMIFEGSPTEEARRLGFDLRINNVDSSGVQTITLSNPISFNIEEYMRKHTHTNLGKSFNFN